MGKKIRIGHVLNRSLICFPQGLPGVICVFRSRILFWVKWYCCGTCTWTFQIVQTNVRVTIFFTCLWPRIVLKTWSSLNQPSPLGWFHTVTTKHHPQKTIVSSKTSAASSSSNLFTGASWVWVDYCTKIGHHGHHYLESPTCLQMWCRCQKDYHLIKCLNLQIVQNHKRKQNAPVQSKTNKIGFEIWNINTSKLTPLKWGVTQGQ